MTVKTETYYVTEWGPAGHPIRDPRFSTLLGARERLVFLRSQGCEAKIICVTVNEEEVKEANGCD